MFLNFNQNFVRVLQQPTKHTLDLFTLKRKFLKNDLCHYINVVNFHHPVGLFRDVYTKAECKEIFNKTFNTQI
jgi:hypothetical protein